MKVFTWSDGFHAFSVAARSRPKALEAWGVGRDLFRDGEAREITEGADFEAAMAQPGQVVRRGLEIDTKKISRRPAAPARKPSKPVRGRAEPAAAPPPAPTARRKPAGPSARDRAAVARLQDELKALDDDHAAALEAFKARRAALEREGASLRERHETARRKLVARLKAARGKL